MRLFLAIAIAGLLSVQMVSAQTEVSGEVSGEWTVDDSPYIVVDSTWVPEDEELSIRAGVEILFDPNLGLYVFGQIFVEGTEEDSVIIYCSNEEEQWTGIHLFNPDSLSTFIYLSSRNAISSFIIDHSVDLDIRHSTIHCSDVPVGHYDGEHGDHQVTIDHCHFEAGAQFYFMGSVLSVSNCNINAGHDGNEEERNSSWGFYLWGCIIEMENTEMVGGVEMWAGVSQFRNCDFLLSPDPYGRLFRVDVVGRNGLMQNCYSQRKVIIGPVGFGDNAGNILISNCVIDNELDGDAFSGRIEGTEISDALYLRDPTEITIQDCILHSVYTRGSVDLLLKDCFISGEEG